MRFQEFMQSNKYRYAVVTNDTKDLDFVLEQFDLLPSQCLLREVDQTEAHKILEALLWKDLAYSHPRMPEDKAKQYAKEIITEHGTPNSKFYTNQEPDGFGWYGLTKSTFDAGVIIDKGNDQYVCIWFEDED